MVCSTMLLIWANSLGDKGTNSLPITFPFLSFLSIYFPSTTTAAVTLFRVANSPFDFETLLEIS